ncbi:dCTP deaminase [Candidatus Parvarchaeota archaeon]|nr:dCTP deaminase [Candidatus Parvarchaeota archaeon]
MFKMILSDKDIREEIASGSLILDPLSDDTIRENGVDLRIGDEIMRFNKIEAPVNISEKESLEKVYLRESPKESFILGKNERILVKIKERVTIPDYIVGFCNLRSTFARLGVSIPPTIVDAGFSGYLTILIIGGGVPIELGTGTRFLHLVLSRTQTKVESPYAGKYQKSGGVTGAKGLN